MRRGALAAALLAAACGDDGQPAETCVAPGGDAPWFDVAGEPCLRLSSYRFFAGDGAAHEPNLGVEAYQLTSPLFSDYTHKRRFIRLPEGTQMTWSDDEVWELPVGAVIVKTFSYFDDVRDPALGERIIETRLLVHGAEGWRGHVYVWNEEQTEATLTVGGAVVPSAWIDADGRARELDYIVPNPNQCKGCHENADVMRPIGVKSRYLDRDGQLARFVERGMLAGAPADPSAVESVPPFDDEAAPLDARARGWLEINCAHCHNPEGAAGFSGLDLRWMQEEPYQLGVCKPPVAAGAGSGGLQFDIVPGRAAESIIHFRITSTEPDIRMPELLHQLVHEEGAALIGEWIDSMTGGCP
jgi:uncharacterized repeat protein (TIGR03806 family)